MSAQEFILIPKDSYIKKQPRALDVLDEPTAVEKAKLLTILQREPERKKKLETVSKTETKPEDIKPEYSNHCLCSNPQKRKSQSRYWTKLLAATKFPLMMTLKLKLMTEQPLWMQTPSFSIFNKAGPTFPVKTLTINEY